MLREQVAVPTDRIELLDDAGGRVRDASAKSEFFGAAYEVWVYEAVVR